MRIAYACYLTALGHQGVARKIEMQTSTWADAGHDVSLFCLSDSATALPLAATTTVFGSLRERVDATRQLVRMIATCAPDVAYLRYDLFLPPLTKLLRSVATVVELNSDLAREIRLWDERLPGTKAYERLNKRLTLGHAAGIVCTAHELQRSVVPSSVKAPCIVIGNGVDLATMTPLAAPRNDRPRAVYIGFPGQPWQGVDKLLHLAKLSPDVDFDLIGLARNDLGDELPANVTVHGVLERHEYEAVFAASDIGVGPLALHRKGLEEAATLKIREYLAYGLPTLLAQLDPDFMDVDRWFFLRIPNSEDNVERHAREIREFAHAMRGRRVARHEIEENISVVHKEERRLEFMRRCAGQLD